MKFYHGTTEEYWKEIQKEGVLWGRKNVDYGHGKICRITWLAMNKEDAGIYDDEGLTDKECVLLEVDMPEITWCETWQITIYEPIPLDKIRRIK